MNSLALCERQPAVFSALQAIWPLAPHCVAEGETAGSPADPHDHCDLSDEELVRRVATEPNWFLPLFHRYYERVLNFLYRRTRDRDLAEDLTSQTFLKALEFLRHRREIASFRSWLYRVAINVHLSHQRSLTRWLKHIESFWTYRRSASATTAHQAMASEKEAAQVRRELQALPDKIRLAILLRYDEELSYQEIGDVLGIEESTARSRVFRGLAVLRKRLGRREAGNNG